MPATTTFGTKVLYRGYTLKSKVEFQWARYYEVEGYAWEYEPVTFRDGRDSYKPDFRLDQIIFVETKAFGAKRIKNRFHLCTAPLLLVFGIPDSCYIFLKPARADEFLPQRFRTWDPAYQKAIA